MVSTFERRLNHALTPLRLLWQRQWLATLKLDFHTSPPTMILCHGKQYSLFERNHWCQDRWIMWWCSYPIPKGQLAPSSSVQYYCSTYNNPIRICASPSQNEILLWLDIPSDHYLSVFVFNVRQKTYRMLMSFPHTLLSAHCLIRRYATQATLGSHPLLVPINLLLGIRTTAQMSWKPMKNYTHSTYPLTRVPYSY